MHNENINGLIVKDNKLIKCRSKIQQIIIPEEVHEICENAFEGCNDITEVILNDRLEVIGEKAFHNCYNLERLVAEDCAPIIARDAFDGCTRLIEKYSKISGCIFVGRTLFKYRENGERVVLIPDKIRTINYEAFSSKEYGRLSYKSNLDIIDFRNVNNRVRIGMGAFRNCNISELYLPQSVDIDSRFCDLPLIGHCKRLKKVYMPNDLMYDIDLFGYRDIAEATGLFWVDPRLDLFVSHEKYEELKSHNQLHIIHRREVQKGYPLDWYTMIEDVVFNDISLINSAM